MPFGLNFNNNVRAIDMKKRTGYWGFIDGVVYGDPLGLLNDSTTPTLTGISGGTIAHGSSNNTITLTGTNLNDNCDVTFSNTGIRPQTITPNAGKTQLTIVVNVNSGATTGASMDCGIR